MNLTGWQKKWIQNEQNTSAEVQELLDLLTTTRQNFTNLCNPEICINHDHITETLL